MDTGARWAGEEQQQAALRGLSPAPTPQDAAVWAAGRSAVSCALTAVQAAGTHGAQWEHCAAPLTEQC